MLRIIPDFLGVVGFGTLIADVDAKMVRVDVIHLRGKYTVRSRNDPRTSWNLMKAVREKRRVAIYSKHALAHNKVRQT